MIRQDQISHEPLSPSLEGSTFIPQGAGRNTMNQPTWEQRIAILDYYVGCWTWVVVAFVVATVLSSLWAARIQRKDPYGGHPIWILPISIGVFGILAVFAGVVVRGERGAARIQAKFNTPASGVILYEGGKLKETP